jgi:hypothetical protein
MATTKPLPLDGAAIGLSMACLVHCLGLPMLFALLPAAAGAFSPPEWVHLLAFLLAVPASAAAMTAGFRHHGTWLPIGFGVTGLGLLALGLLSEASEVLETGLTVSGSVMLAIGHLANWRRRRRPRSAAGPAGP